MVSLVVISFMGVMVMIVLMEEQEMMSSIVMQEMTLSMVVVGLITIEQTIATVPQG
jgi:hypothetical protein